MILSDFAELGNGEMEFDNIEITANRTVPEPGSLLLAAVGFAGVSRGIVNRVKVDRTTSEHAQSHAVPLAPSALSPGICGCRVPQVR